MTLIIILVIAIIVIAVLIISFRCFYSVDEQHNAVVTQFGKVVKVNTAGFYAKEFISMSAGDYKIIKM